MQKINLCHLKERKTDEAFLPFLGDMDRDFGAPGIGIAKIRLQIRTRLPRN